MVVQTFIILFVALTTIAFGQQTYSGACPQVTVQKDFNVTAYAGYWYEIKKYPAVFQVGADCARATYTVKDSTTVEVINTSTRNGKPSNVTGTAKVVDPSVPAKLVVNFSQQSGRARGSGNYWVLGTDYENFSVVWSCTDRGMSNSRLAWVLSRTPTLKDESSALVNKILEDNNVDQAPFVPSKHDATCKNYNFSDLQDTAEA